LAPAVQPSRPSSLLIEVTEAGQIAVRTDGLPLQPAIGNIGGESFEGRADGPASWRWDLAAGWYVLRLNPISGCTGRLDLTIGPPGPVPPLSWQRRGHNVAAL
jgi:hypothetical protein